MLYLTYDEYSTIGGVVDLATFNRTIDRVCGIIDKETNNRLVEMENIPSQAKALCRDLVEYIATNNNVNEKPVSSWSESAGGVSESVSYTPKTNDNIEGDIDEMLSDYLGALTNGNGVPLLYKGAKR